jgi:hypothetical protein
MQWNVVDVTIFEAYAGWARAADWRFSVLSRVVRCRTLVRLGRDSGSWI